MKLFRNKEFILYLIIFIFCIFSSFVIYQTSLRFNSDRHLILLSEQFLRLHLAIPINQDLPLGDVADYYHNFYLYFGPFSSIFLMPFVFIFGKGLSQSIIGIFSLTASFISIFYISKKFNFKTLNSLWLSLFFTFSTVLLSASLINISAYQVEVLGVPFILLAFLEYFSKKRPFVIGLFLSLAVLTRITLIFAVVFFILEFFQKRLTKKQIIYLLIPVLISLIVLGLYNQRRFHSFFELGYKYSRNLNSFPLSHNLQFGYQSINHIPANLYALFIKPPEPVLQDKFGFVLKYPFLKADPWGMAIWFTSPLFLVLLYKFRKSKYTFSSLISIVFILFPTLTYYSIGYSQFGYRYSLDFLPFLFLLLVSSLNGKLSRMEICLIIAGIIFNAIFITSLWNIYPLLGIN